MTMKISDETDGGGDQKDSGGKGAGNAHRLQPFADKEIGHAVHTVFHGVVNTPAGDQGEKGDEEVSGDGSLPNPAHDFGVGRNDQSGEERLNNGAVYQGGGDEIDQPAKHTAQPAEKNTEAMDVIKKPEAKAGKKGVETGENQIFRHYTTPNRRAIHRAAAVLRAIKTPTKTASAVLLIPVIMSPVMMSRMALVKAMPGTRDIRAPMMITS